MSSGSWPSFFLLAMFLVLLLLPTLSRSLGKAWSGTLMSTALCISQVLCYQSLSPFPQENVEAFILKKILKKLLYRLKDEGLQKMEDLTDKFTISSSSRLRADYMILFIILLRSLGESRAFSHGFPKQIPPAFVASMTKLSSGSEGSPIDDFTEYQGKGDGPYLFTCKGKNYKCQPISLDQVLQKYPSTGDSLTALQQCLVRTQYHLQQHYGSCLNISAVVRGTHVTNLHGGKLQPVHCLSDPVFSGVQNRTPDNKVLEEGFDCQQHQGGELEEAG